MTANCVNCAAGNTTPLCGSVPQESAATAQQKDACGMKRIAMLVDLRRAAVAYTAGLDMEIALYFGDRDGAMRAKREMEAQVGARRAAREAGCFFVEQGDLDRELVQGRATA